MSLSGYHAQLKAIHRWGRQQPADLSVITQPVLVANGDHDRMVPMSNTVDLDQPTRVAMYDWWFEPKKDASGKPVADRFQFTINWR